MNRPVPAVARNLAAQLDALFAQDAALARRLDTAQQRLQAANDRLWWGLHPDGLAAVYGEHPAAIDVAFAEHRSEVLGAADPLAAIQRVHWSIAGAFTAYQTAAEERRQLAADIGELTRQFGDALLAAGPNRRPATPTSTNSQTNNPTPSGGTDDGHHPHPASRHRAPRPGAGRARPGKPRPPTPRSPDALAPRHHNRRVARQGRRADPRT